jgi:phosphonate transport system substrate-binding protein
VKLPAKLFSLARIAVLALAAGACSGGGSAEKPITPPGSADPRAGWPKTFRVGLFGGDDAEETLRNAEPMKKLLETRLSIPVTLFTGTSYGAVIEAMRADKVDAMTVGPFSYILAVQEAKAEALVTGVQANAKDPKYDASIQPFYYSIIVTKKGSGITTVQDLKGKDFAFVDPASTSGHLAPKTLLLKNNINPDKDMKTVFAGSHPTSLLSVWNGKTPAGATFENNLLNLATSGQVKWCQYPDGKINVKRTPEELKKQYDACPTDTIVVIAQSDPIPNTPFAVRSNLPESFKTAVKEALLTTKDDPAFIAARKSWYVDPAKDLNLKSLDLFYNPLRDIAKLLNLDLKQLEP